MNAWKTDIARLVATLVIVVGVLAACSSSSDETKSQGSGVTTPSGAASKTQASSPDPAEPNRVTLPTLDPALDDRYTITMKLLDGYRDSNDVVFGPDSGQGISAWTVGNVYAKPCHWSGRLLDPPIGPSVHGLVAGLANQDGFDASTPTDVEIDGYAGTYLERAVSAGVDPATCDDGQYRTWVDPTLEGARWVEARQRDLLWIVDVDGTRLLIDAALGPQTTEQDEADRIQMVESIQIQPV